MNPKQDSEGWFSYKFSFWFVVTCFIAIILGFALPAFYVLKYGGIILLILTILIRFIKDVFEMDR